MSVEHTVSVRGEPNNGIPKTGSKCPIKSKLVDQLIRKIKKGEK